MCLGIQNQKPWQLMPSLVLVLRTIFTWLSISKGKQGEHRSNYTGTRLVNSILVPSANGDDQPRATIFSAISKKSDSSTQTLQELSSTPKTPVNDNQSNATVKFLEASSRQSTHCKYNNYIKHWLAYSKTMGKMEVTHLSDFLSAMFEKGHVYSTINNAKFAIATIVHISPYNSLNKHPLINNNM